MDGKNALFLTAALFAINTSSWATEGEPVQCEKEELLKCEGEVESLKRRINLLHEIDKIGDDRFSKLNEIEKENSALQEKYNVLKEVKKVVMLLALKPFTGKQLRKTVLNLMAELENGYQNEDKWMLLFKNKKFIRLLPRETRKQLATAVTGYFVVANILQQPQTQLPLKHSQSS